MTTVVVVGAGITGLSAAYRLASEPDIDTIVLESSDRVGGKLLTTFVGGVQVEAGADSFLARDDTIPGLCRSLGIAGSLIEPAVFGGLVATPQGLKPLPGGTVMGIPASVRGALGAQALTPRGRLRALRDLVVSGPLRGPDTSVGAFVRKRFGTEVLERLVDPLLAGTRAGAPDDVSLAAALPQIDAAARSSRSLMRGLGAGSKPRFYSFPGGMTTLTDALARHAGEVRTSVTVGHIEGHSRGFSVTTDGGAVAADAVIVTAPIHSAAPMLEAIAPDAAENLARITFASVASIVMVFDEPPDVPGGSSGVLIPSGANMNLSAATWWSLKWPHTSGGSGAIRAFIGRAGNHPALRLGDEDLVAIARAELQGLVGSLPEPAETGVHRWAHGLPQYRVGHLDLVAKIEAGLPPGVAVAGAGLRGSGIPDCFAQGVGAAERILEGLNETRS